MNIYVHKYYMYSDWISSPKLNKPDVYVCSYPYIVSVPSILIMIIHFCRGSSPTDTLLDCMSSRLIISKIFTRLTSSISGMSTRTVNGSPSGYVGRGNHDTTAKSWNRRHPQTTRTNRFTSPYIDRPDMALVTTEPHRRPGIRFSPALKLFPPITALEYWKLLHRATWQPQGKDIMWTNSSERWICFEIPVTCCKVVVVVVVCVCVCVWCCALACVIIYTDCVWCVCMWLWCLVVVCVRVWVRVWRCVFAVVVLW